MIRWDKDGREEGALISTPSSLGVGINSLNLVTTQYRFAIGVKAKPTTDLAGHAG